LGVGNILKNKAMENCKLAYTLQFTQKKYKYMYRTRSFVSCFKLNAYYLLRIITTLLTIFYYFDIL